jgi:hypothetical protein
MAEHDEENGVLRRAIAIVVPIVIALAGGRALGEDAACKFRSSGPNYIEWLERGQLRGARLRSHDAKWQLGGNQHVTVAAGCRSCVDGAGLGAALRFGVISPRTYSVERAISPDNVAKFTWDIRSISPACALESNQSASTQL